VAPMRLARLALPTCERSGPERIVNVSSIYGRATTPLTGWYQASKHALEGASDALRAEVAGTGSRWCSSSRDSSARHLDEVEDEVQGRAGSGFGPSYQRLLANTRMANPIMSDPSKVADVIATSVTSRHPRTGIWSDAMPR